MLSSESEQPLLVAGASGTVGRQVVREALARGQHVIALLRDPDLRQELAGQEPALAARLDVVVLPTMSQQALERALGDRAFGAVVSCVASRSGVASDAWEVDYQLNADLLSIARRRGGSSFVLLSAICVQKPRLAFQRAKLEFERRLAESGLRYSIVRPTAFFKSVSGQIDRVRKGKPYLVFGSGELTACAPIDDRELAAYLLDCLDDPARANQVLPVGGPGPALTPRAQGALLFEQLDRAPRFRQVPVALFTVAIAVLAPLARWFPALADKAELARIGHYYATESMLVWDTEQNRYDADATPSAGQVTLADYYRRVLADEQGVELARAQRVFDR
jgi:divinyl chlorophyllide a 8-vinyl-reductase